MKTTIILVLSVSWLYGTAPIITSPSVDIATPPKNQTDKELSWVDDQILAILPARVGVSEGYINALKDPMKMKASAITAKNGGSLLAPPKLGAALLPPLPKVVEEPLRLLAIMNKSVLINGKWYKAGEKVRNFTLSEIRNNSVLLTGAKNQQLILFLTKQNSNIKIITK